MNKTPLNDRHYALKARMTDYAGWDMPLQYEGIIEEVLAVREKAGMFDVSHMGEVLIRGRGSGGFLNWLLSHELAKGDPELISYAIICNDEGGVVDDCLVYRIAPESYLLIVNAANKEKDLAHIAESIELYEERYPGRELDIEVCDETDHYALIAIQGPESLPVMLSMAEPLGLGEKGNEVLEALEIFHHIQVEVHGQKRNMMISRTGYTGERGYEIFCPAEVAAAIWDELLDKGVVPCGLGARDTLRLEAGLPLYGHELSAEINPLEGGMSSAVDFDHEFRGRNKMKANTTRELIALLGEERELPREGYPVFVGDLEVGFITSGGFSPTLRKGIALALVKADSVGLAEEVRVKIRKRGIPFKVVAPPFVKSVNFKYSD